MEKKARSHSASEWALFILPALRGAKDLIDREYAQPLDLDEIASAAGYSKYHFSRSFAVAFGEGPAAYLTRRRVERAKSLLRGANLNVTEVCFMVGFESVGSFSSLFRRLVGLTPSLYRAEAMKSGGSPPVPGCVVMMWTRPRPKPNSKPREALTTNPELE
jgi:AraC-like DNA-binding protein